MNEHDLIARYLTPLAKNFPGSLNLSDDAALINVPAGQQLVVTGDAIAESVHYLPGTDPKLIAQKLLRTNLSDLASMGATPLCYFLSIALLKPLSEEFIARFAEGLKEDQNEFHIHLAGGDTIASQSPVFSITAHGLVPQGKALRRNAAKAGDHLYVSGTLGDAALGLASLRGGKADAAIHLQNRYHLPQPRLALGESLRGFATSCIDISDGLLADAGHITGASHTGIEIDQKKLPLSPEAKTQIEQSPDLWPLIYSGGDDYELLFTLPEGVAAPHGTTHIGRVIQGSGVKLFKDGKEVPVNKAGYSH